MTLTETRQLGIEVERRLQTILPALEIVHKIDTEDIYSFLNQFQTLFIDAIYRQDDQVISGTRVATIIEDILRTLTLHEILSTIQEDTTLDTNNTVFKLPEDYYQYIRSVSKVSSTYNGSCDSTLSNILLKQSDANAVINQLYDKNRILRNPAVILEDDKIKIIHDVYTSIDSVDLTYIRRPKSFSVLTEEPCELPYECFESLVSGTVDLYLRHLTATQPKQELNKEAEQ